MQPLIVTLKLDARTFEHFNRLREEHFPAHLNHLSAHLTLFHHLPGEERDTVEADLREAAPPAPVALQVTGLRSLGRGVAFDLVSPALDALRAELARRWARWLTPQDRQGFRPHVTVQNKVTPDEARALKALLTAGFSPFPAQGEAFQLWRYLEGPWALESTAPFGP
ncbi:2'-5' RNA ligase [Stigmatella aurantiaca]|uniref:2'-5' RNA ligase n=1 Tax=Stigmatella aurantiaca TaxID=41 RepID=A0A1H8AUH5_STIAU|nr:2'-5' RNA ligase family protein [Stigmatella aurantiaca]SEM74402.1 2'-5' RNA ligase [Stigmatella aurantiaca]